MDDHRGSARPQVTSSELEIFSVEFAVHLRSSTQGRLTFLPALSGSVILSALTPNMMHVASMVSFTPYGGLDRLLTCASEQPGWGCGFMWACGAIDQMNLYLECESQCSSLIDSRHQCAMLAAVQRQ